MNEYVFGIDGLSDYERNKNKASSQLHNIFNDDRFNVVDEGNKGSHSMRTFATTNARGSGFIFRHFFFLS